MSIDVGAVRAPQFPIETLLRDRWSARAMSGETLPRDRLMQLFEAARWAPSAFNAQPWHFVFAERDSAHWPRLFGLLAESNQVWCKEAAALLVLIGRHVNESGRPLRTFAFDCGAAWENLALQATRMGLVAHAMGGFDLERARSDLKVPDDHTVLAMIAIGLPGPVERLPEAQQAREVPSQRRPVHDSISEGLFGGP